MGGRKISGETRGGWKLETGETLNRSQRRVRRRVFLVLLH